MAVSIGPGSSTRLQRHSTGFVLSVEATDGTATRAALERTRARLMELDDPDPELGLDLRSDRNEVAHVSPVMATPSGAAVYVDGGDVSPILLVRVLDWAVEDLHEHGVSDAVVAVPGASPVWEQLAGQPAGPRLSLARLPRISLTAEPAPGSWAGLAAEWLLADPALTVQGIRALVASQDFRIGPADIGTVLDLEHPGRIGFRSVLVGDPEVGVRFVTYDCTVSYVLTLGTIGSAATPPGDHERWLVARAEAGAGDVDYAWLELPRGYPLWLEPGDPNGLATDDSGRPPRFDHMAVIDEVALDAFPFQVLGPSHLARLGELSEARPLAGGRVSWQLGSTVDWADDRRATELRALGQTMLAPVLLDRDPLYELSSARLRAEIAERHRLRQES